MMANDIQKNIKDIRSKIKEKDSIMMDLDLFERMINWHNSFSNSCQECSMLLERAQPHFLEIKKNKGELNRQTKKENNALREDMLKHLRKRHGLYRMGHFMGLFVPLGISIGLPFGLHNNSIISSTVAGIAIGYVIGIVVENFISKKGKRI